MKKTMIISKDSNEGILECTWSEGCISIMCMFDNMNAFNPNNTYVLEILSAKKPNLRPYRVAEAEFKNNKVNFNGVVCDDVLKKYGYVMLDMDTFVICERKTDQINFTPYLKGFSGLVWNVDSKYANLPANDPAIAEAKSRLDSLKGNVDLQNGKKQKNFYLESISKKLLEYTENHILPRPYTWYNVSKMYPVCNLSSLRHALFSPPVAETVYKEGGYFMGIHENHLALAVKTPENSMPFTTLSDVAQPYKDEKSGQNYCIVGISLEDDGQYFEKILAFSGK